MLYSPHGSNITTNKIPNQFLQAPKWLTLADTEDNAGTSTMLSFKLIPRKTLKNTQFGLNGSQPVNLMADLVGPRHRAYVTSTVLLTSQK